MTPIFNRWQDEDNRHAIIESITGDKVTNIVKVEDFKRYIRVTYTKWFSTEYLTVDLLYGKTAAVKGRRWLRMVSW